jgi:hypothetical protein
MFRAAVKGSHCASRWGFQSVGRVSQASVQGFSCAERGSSDLCGIKLVNGALDVYGPTEIKTQEKAHERYAALAECFSNQYRSVVIATHNVALLKKSLGYFESNNVPGVAMLHPAAEMLSKSDLLGVEKYAYMVVTQNGKKYAERRVDEMSDPKNQSALLDRMLECSDSSTVAVASLAKVRHSLVASFPNVAPVILDPLFSTAPAKRLFQQTFTHSVDTVVPCMHQYVEKGITPWVSLTTLEDLEPQNVEDLNNALDQEYEHYKTICDGYNTKLNMPPITLGLRTHLIEGESFDSHGDLFSNHVFRLLDIPGVDRVIFDYEGPDNQVVIEKVCNGFPPHEVGYTERAIDKPPELA